jgi:hypothetical protein
MGIMVLRMLGGILRVVTKIMQEEDDYPELRVHAVNCILSVMTI